MEESFESLKERIRQLEEENRLLKLQLQRFLKEEVLPAKVEFVKETVAVPKDNNLQQLKNENEFLTYKKKPGTCDVGKEYEYMTCALYALKLSTSDEVTDFEMTTNELKYGDFDDISLKIYFKNGTTTHTLFQLKHKEDAKKQLTDTDFSSPNNDFSLVKYLTSFEKIDVDDATLVLYTNLRTRMKDNYEFVIQPNPEDHKLLLLCAKEFDGRSLDLLNNLPGEQEPEIFQFNIIQDGTSFKKVSEFSKRFHLFPNQMNINQVRSFVRQILETLLHQDIYDLFVGFIRTWWLGRFVLTKSDILAKIAEMALKPWVRNLSSDKLNPKSELLVKTIMGHQMTIVQNLEDDIVDKIWSQVVEEEERIGKASKKYVVGREEALWFLNLRPLVITVDDDNREKVKSALCLLTNKKKIVLVGKIKRDDFPEWNIFGTLANLCEEVYNEVVNTFKVSIQGRPPISLQRLIRCDKEVENIVTVKELLEMTQGELTIGSQVANNLPEVYIPRIVSSPEEDLSSIREEELFKYFNDYLNIFCAPPGMGKTTLFQILSGKYCPSHFWSFYVTLINCNTFLRSKPSKHQILHYFCQVNETSDDFVAKIRNVLFRNKKFHLFLDGVDELETVSQNLLLSFIEYVSSDDTYVWVSARESLQQKICQKLDKKSLIIEELDKDQQRNYIYDRLVNNYTEDELQKILNVVFDSSDVTHSRQLLAIPLQLYIITEMFRNNRDSYEKLSKENIFVLTKMYKLFFEGKKKFSYGKLGVSDYDYQLGTSFDHHLKQYEVLGLKSCLDYAHFQRLGIDQNSYIDYFVQIKENGEKFGIILKIDTDDQIVFNHQTYAEYFACVWFKSHLDKVRLLCQELFSTRYDNLKRIFDIMMAEQNPLHLAVIYKNMEQFGKHIDDDKCDDGGRTALHIACSYGNKSPGKNESSVWLDIEREATIFKETIDVLVTKTSNVWNVDQIFDFTCFDYSLVSHCLYPIEKMLQLKKLQLNQDFNKIFDYFDPENLAEYCARLGYPNLLLAVIQTKGIDVNNVKNSDFGLLANAVHGCFSDTIDTPREGNIAVVDILLKNGADIHQINTFSDISILDYACQFRCYDMLDILTINGAKCTNENTVLHRIATHEVLNDHLLNQIDINTQNGDGETALHCACYKGSLENVVKLLESGADVNILDNRERNVFISAVLANESQDEKMAVLINHGVDINTVDNICGGALHYVVRLWKQDLVRKLLNKYKFDVNIRNKKQETPLHVACESDSSAGMVQVLIDFDADVNVVNKYKQTPIRLALKSRSDKEEKVQLLIDNDAFLDVQDEDGKTMIHHVCNLFKSEDILKKLLQAGANVNIGDVKGRRPVHYASGDDNKLKILVEYHADINAQDGAGQTPLHVACSEGRVIFMKNLLELGADINIVDDNGSTALDLALRRSYLREEILELLAQYRCDTLLTSENS